MGHRLSLRRLLAIGLSADAASAVTPCRVGRGADDRLAALRRAAVARGGGRGRRRDPDLAGRVHRRRDPGVVLRRTVVGDVLHGHRRLYAAGGCHRCRGCDGGCGRPGLGNGPPSARLATGRRLSIEPTPTLRDRTPPRHTAADRCGHGRARLDPPRARGVHRWLAAKRPDGARLVGAPVCAVVPPAARRGGGGGRRLRLLVDDRRLGHADAGGMAAVHVRRRSSARSRRLAEDRLAAVSPGRVQPRPPKVSRTPVGPDPRRG